MEVEILRKDIHKTSEGLVRCKTFFALEGKEFKKILATETFGELSNKELKSRIKRALKNEKDENRI